MGACKSWIDVGLVWSGLKIFFLTNVNSADLHLDSRYPPVVAFSQLASCPFWSLRLFRRLPSSSSLKPSQGLLIDAFTRLQLVLMNLEREVSQDNLLFLYAVGWLDGWHVYIP